MILYIGKHCIYFHELLDYFQFLHFAYLPCPWHSWCYRSFYRMSVCYGLFVFFCFLPSTAKKILYHWVKLASSSLSIDLNFIMIVFSSWFSGGNIAEAILLRFSGCSYLVVLVTSPCWEKILDKIILRKDRPVLAPTLKSVVHNGRKAWYEVQHEQWELDHIWGNLEVQKLEFFDSIICSFPHFIQSNTPVYRKSPSTFTMAFHLSFRTGNVLIGTPKIVSS